MEFKRAELIKQGISSFHIIWSIYCRTVSIGSSFLYVCVKVCLYPSSDLQTKEKWVSLAWRSQKFSKLEGPLKVWEREKGEGCALVTKTKVSKA